MLMQTTLNQHARCLPAGCTLPGGEEWDLAGGSRASGQGKQQLLATIWSTLNCDTADDSTCREQIWMRPAYMAGGTPLRKGAPSV